MYSKMVKTKGDRIVFASANSIRQVILFRVCRKLAFSQGSQKEQVDRCGVSDP